MFRIYCAALIGGAIFFAYFVGARITNIKCNERIARTNVQQIIINNKAVENTNDTIFRTSVGDIRRILREKYTIAE